jgi:hypothetical protein
VRAAATLTRSESTLCSGLVDGRPHARHGPRRCRACRSNHKVRRAGVRWRREFRICTETRMGGAGERKRRSEGSATPTRDRERRGCRARGAARCRVGSTVLSAPPYREWHCSRTCFFLTIVWGIKWRHVGCSARLRAKGTGSVLAARTGGSIEHGTAQV